MAVEIREHQLGKDLDDFVRVPHEIYRGDPAWVPPLEMDIRGRLNPKENPFFLHAEGTAFTAWRNGRLVGRVTAQIDREHLKRHQDETGFFGFIDTVDDPAVAKALLDEAARWLAARGMKRMRGPMSLSINEEIGVLVDGFDTPPYIMMSHHRPYQGALIEQAGLAKAKDVFAWKYEAGSLTKRAEKAWEDVRAMPEVRIRSVDKSKMADELKIVMDIFNDAWSDNWGFVPMTPEELEKTAKDFKLILDEDLAFIAEIEGKPQAMCICIPNVNEVIQDLDGKLFPLGVFKLLWRMKVKHPSSARLALLGIRKELRHAKRYGALSMALYVELHKRGTAKGYTHGELSWTLEDNAPVNLGIKAMGGKIYKKYRVYEKALGNGHAR